MPFTINQSTNYRSIEIVWTWTADGAGAVASEAVPNGFKLTGYCVGIAADPGSTAPTDNYDVTVTDENGVDVLGGNGANLDTANSEYRPALSYNAVDGVNVTEPPLIVNQGLTFNLSGNLVAAATGVIRFRGIKV